MPSRTLSTANCFFFSREPAMYVSLHGSPTTTTPEAIFAQDAITDWAKKRADTNIEDWLTGWRVHGRTNDSMISNKRPADKQSTPHHIKHSKPTITIKCINIGTNDIKCYTETDNTLHMTKLSLQILQDTRNLTALTRRMTTIDNSFICPKVTWILNHDATINTDISHTLGIDTKYIVNTLKPAQQPFHLTSPDMPTPSRTIDPTPEYIIPTEQTPSHTPAQTLRSPSPLSLNPSPSYDPESPYMDPLQFTKDHHISNAPIYNPTPITACTQVTTQDTTDFSGQVTTQDTTHETTTSTQVTSQDTTDFSGPVNTQDTTHETTTSTQVTSQDTTTNFSDPVTTQDTTQDTIQDNTHTTSKSTTQEEAIQLLKFGSYPLLPAARREWSAVSDESIKLASNLFWPPRDWRSMTADQRTLNSEYAAMTLHRLDTPHYTTDRATLLHKFNFIVLPGGASTTQTTLSIAQNHNFNLVKEIAQNKTKLSSEEQKTIIRSFNITKSKYQHAVRHVPLRLQKK